MGGRQGHRWLAQALGLVLLLHLLGIPSPADALSWRLPGRGAAPLTHPAGAPTKQQLRETAPPAWVQQARPALEDRDPRVRILAPTDGDLLPEGPWTLRLQVEDWPLVDGGPLGLGPHLVVQLDGDPPRPTVDTAVEMPPLSPGSHLLTVYAAKPWGEAHKSPLALRQIRLHRLAANPATLPAPGTPQLIPVSPSGMAGDPPLLLDWLLIDAPLQGLRGDASGWRLRLTVNGESVLVDQQTPLWLQGWKPGSNALLLELLDGRGEPLNPPFNSLLREVIVPKAGAGGPTRTPAAPLSDLELAVLLGDQPVSALTPPAPVPPEPAKEAPAPPHQEQAPPQETPEPQAQIALETPNPSGSGSEPTADIPAQSDSLSRSDSPTALEANAVSNADSLPDSAPPRESAPPPEDNRAALPPPEDSRASLPPSAEAPPSSEPPPAPKAAASDPEPAPSDAAAPSLPPAASPLEPATPGPAAPPVAPATPVPDVPPEASAAETAQPAPLPARPAREELNADGTLKRAPRPTPAQWLRERLGR